MAFLSRGVARYECALSDRHDLEGGVTETPCLGAPEGTGELLRECFALVRHRQTLRARTDAAVVDAADLEHGGELSWGRGYDRFVIGTSLNRSRPSENLDNVGKS